MNFPPDKCFFINDQVVGYVSLFMILGFVLVRIYQRRAGGYFAPREIFYFFLAQLLLIGSSILMAGFGLTDGDFFYAIRWLFALPAILFLFLLIFKYPDTTFPVSYQRERIAVYLTLGLQYLINIWWLISLLFPSIQVLPPAWLDGTRGILILLTCLWLFSLARRRAKVLNEQNEIKAATFLYRISWALLFVAFMLLIAVLRGQTSFFANLHAKVAIYGWIVINVASVFAFLGQQQDEQVYVTRTSLVIALVAYLIVGGVTYFFSASLLSMDRVALAPKELDQILRPIVLAQFVLAFLLYFVLPRLLRMILPKTDAVSEVISAEWMTSRQRDVMRLLARDLSNKQIASQLYVTERTVKHHVALLLTKYKRINRYELSEVARAMIEQKVL